MSAWKALAAAGALLIPVSWCFGLPLQCHVIHDGVDIAGAKVTLTVGTRNVVSTTDEQGMCEFEDIAGTNLNVFAEKVIDGKLYGAWQRGISIDPPDDGPGGDMPGPPAQPIPGGAVNPPPLYDLDLKRAIRLTQFLPLKKDDTWEYHCVNTNAVSSTCTRHEWVQSIHEPNGPGRSVILITETGPAPRESYQRVTATGWTIFGGKDGARTTTYSPPLRLPNLMVLGDTFRVECMVLHSGEPLPAQMTVEAEMTGFETIKVPAGRFADCPRLELKMSIEGGSEERRILWLARGIGQVRVYEKKRGRTHRRSLVDHGVHPKTMTPNRPRIPTLMRPGL